MAVKKRGVRLWILLAGFLVLSVYGWLRLAYSLQDWYWLESAAGVDPGPLYLAVSGGLWGLTGAVALLWILLARPGYRAAGMISALVLALTYWIDRFFISARGAGGNLWFAVGFTLLCLGYTALVLRPDKVLRRQHAVVEEQGNGEK